MKFYLIFFLACNLKILAMCETISEKEALIIIDKEGCYQLNTIPDQSSNIYFFYEQEKVMIIYELNKDSYLICNDIEQLFKNFSVTERFNLITPLFYYRNELDNFQDYKNKFLTCFFNDFGIETPSKIDKIDLKLIDDLLGEYGYEKAYENYFLSIIILCGEYVICKNSSCGWMIKDNFFNPAEKSIFFLNEEENELDITSYVKEYLFRINRDDDDLYINSLSEIVELLLLL